MLPPEIKSLRQAYGLTQAQLGRALGVTGQAVWSWENGQYEPAAYQHVVLLRLHEMRLHKDQMALAGAALEDAQYRPPGPKAGVSTKAALAGGLAAFGLGLLLGALFGAEAPAAPAAKRRGRRPSR